MSYFVQNDLIGLVPDEWLVGALDDSGSGTSEVFDEVHAVAKTAIDGAIGSRFKLPLDTTNEALAAQVKDIGVTLAVEALYIRRGVPIDEKSPLSLKIARAYKILDQLRDGTHPLVPAIARAADSIGIIGEDSKVYSASTAA